MYDLGLQKHYHNHGLISVFVVPSRTFVQLLLTHHNHGLISVFVVPSRTFVQLLLTVALILD
jgi:hypothetical protein